MVGVQCLGLGATLHPWTGSTGRAQEEGCPWTTPPTLCPATTTMDPQRAMKTTAVDPPLMLTPASTGALAWTNDIGTVQIWVFEQGHFCVCIAYLGFKSPCVAGYWIPFVWSYLACLFLFASLLVSLCSPNNPLILFSSFHSLQTSSSRWLQNTGSKLQSP